MKQRTKGMIGAVISIFLQLGPAGPATPLFAHDTTSAVTDTVKASRIIHIKSAALPVASLDRKTIEALPASSVADAARYFAGVQIKDYGGVGGLKTVNVRSLGAQHTGISYNGIRMDNAQNGQVDLGRFSLDNLESMTLYQAQKAELLQPASDLASAASVYLKTRAPEKTGLRASLRTGAFGTVNPSGTVSYVKRDIKASVNAGWLYSNGKYRFTFHEPAYDTTATRTNGDIRALHSELYFNWKGLTVNAYGYKSERGLPGPVVRRISDQYSSKDRQWDRSAFIQASWETSFPGNWQLRIGGKFARDYCRYLQDPTQNAAVMKVDNKYRQNELYFYAALAWRPSDWLGAGFSIDGRRNGFSSESETLAAAPVPWAKRLSGLTAAQIAVSPGCGWHIHTSLLSSVFKDKTSAGSAWKSRAKWTPTVIVSYEGLSWLKLRTFYKEIFRAPTFNDLYYSIGGRTNLSPEYSRQLDAGADVSIGKVFKLSADTYLAGIINKIVAIPAASQFRWSVINYGKVRAKGVDVSAAASANIKEVETSFRATWSYEDSRDRTDKASRWYGGRTAYSPLHSGSLVAAVDYKGLNACVSWLYTGKRYTDAANIPANELDPWYTTDLAMAWKGSIGKRAKGGIGVDINNIFDQDYEVVTRYPMPGRHILIKLTIEY